jgi:tetratricopeptide (TPR) repeat protein
MITVGLLLLTAATSAAHPQPARQILVSAEAHIDAGLAAYWRLHFAEAERHFQAAVDADPANPEAAYYLAYAVYKIAEPKRPFHPDKQRAARLFARAFELDPHFAPSWQPHHRSN